MPQRIDVPGMGVVEFPDGMSDAQIVEAIQKNKPAPSTTPPQPAQPKGEPFFTPAKTSGEALRQALPGGGIAAKYLGHVAKGVGGVIKEFVDPAYRAAAGEQVGTEQMIAPAANAALLFGLRGAPGGARPSAPGPATPPRSAVPEVAAPPAAPAMPPPGPGAPPVVRPEQSQLLSGISREPFRDVATETQKALQVERGKKQAEVSAKFEEPLDKPGEFAPGSLQTAGQKIRGVIEQSGMPIDQQNTPASLAALNLLDKIPGFKPRKPPDPMAPVTGVKADVGGIKLNLREVDTARRRLNSFWQAAQRNPTDRAVFGDIMQEFGKHVENVMAEGLFSGDPQVLEMLKAARQMSAAEKKLFGEKRRPGDDAGLALQKILKEGRSPEEISNYLYGANNTRLLDMIETALGKEHPLMLKIKKGAWDHALETRNGVQKLVSNSTVSKKLFTPEEINLMKQYLVMKEMPPKPKYRPPKPDEVPPPPRDWKREIAVKIGALLAGATVGRAAGSIVPIPGVHHFTKAAVKKGIENRYLGTDE